MQWGNETDLLYNCQMQVLQGKIMIYSIKIFLTDNGQTLIIIIPIKVDIFSKAENNAIDCRLQDSEALIEKWM